MKARYTNRLSTGLGVLISINLFISLAFAQNTQVEGKLGIAPCTGINCLQLITPSSLSLGPQAHILSNEESRLSIVSNQITEQLTVIDSRENGEFMITIDIDDLLKEGGTETIPRNNIGIMSYNGDIATPEAITVDSLPVDPTVQSLIDPDSWPGFQNGQNETYSQINENPNYIPDNWITYFNGGSVTILQATPGPRKNSYQIGLVYFFRTPAKPYQPDAPQLTLRDGTYSTTATFTLQIP